MADAGYVTVYCDGCHHDIHLPVHTVDTDPVTLHVDHRWLATHIADHITAA
jgi:hypothetical protein